MNCSRTACLLLAASLVLGAGLRLWGAAGKKAMGYDAPISLLAAAGKIGAYHELQREKCPPARTWVRASEWKKFLRPEGLSLRRIRYDLAHYDVHPPLYFWLLHLWFLAFGAGLFKGYLLNILFFAPSVLVLFSLARSCLKDDRSAALVAFIWSLSPAVVHTSFVLRSYQLLVLCELLFIREILLVSEPSRPPAPGNYLKLTLAGAAGLLTHYQFAIVVAGGLVFFFARSTRFDRRRRAVGLVSLLCTFMILFALHPNFFLSYSRQRAQAGEYRFADVGSRAEKVFSSIMAFFIGNPFWQRVVAVAAAALALTVLISYLRKRGRGEIPRGREKRSVGPVMFFLVWVAGFIILLYLGRVQTWQQMGERYMSMVYPLLAFVLVAALDLWPKGKRALGICLILGITLSVLLRTVRWRRLQEMAVLRRVGALAGGRTVLLDNINREFLIPVIWYVPDESPVLAAEQDYLLENRQIWLEKMVPAGIYVSRAWRGEREKQEKLLALISARYDVEEAGAGFRVWNYAYTIREGSP